MPFRTDVLSEPWGAFLRELDQIATEPVAFLVDRHLRAALFAHIGQNS